MVNLTAADTTAVRKSVVMLYSNGQRRTTNPIVEVRARLTVSTATRTDYPTGGILLTNQFTTGNASDLGFDVSQPIELVSQARLRKTATDYTVAMPCELAHTIGSAPTLVCYLGDANAADSAEREHPNSDMTAATSFGAAGSHVCDITLRGVLRGGVSIEDLGGQK